MDIATTRVFQNGNSQAIRIPAEMRTNIKEYFIGKSVICLSSTRLMTRGLLPARWLAPSRKTF